MGKNLSVDFNQIMMNEFGGQQVELLLSGIKDKNGNVIETEIYSSMTVPQKSNVRGTEIKGEYDGKGGVDVRWHYSGVISGEGFLLERLYHTVFEPISVHENLEKGTDYWHLDKFNYRDEIYYRIKYLGKEGVYSKIIKVNLSDSLELVPIATIYPNPSPDRRKIKFRLLTRDFDTDLKVRVFSELGLLIKEKDFESAQIENTLFNVDFKSDLAAGIYYVEVIQGSHTSLQKIVIK